MQHMCDFFCGFLELLNNSKSWKGRGFIRFCFAFSGVVPLHGNVSWLLQSWIQLDSTEFLMASCKVPFIDVHIGDLCESPENHTQGFHQGQIETRDLSKIRVLRCRRSMDILCIASLTYLTYLLGRCQFFKFISVNQKPMFVLSIFLRRYRLDVSCDSWILSGHA